MLKTIAPSEMKRIETRVMQETSITGDQLMQAAAAHVAQTVRESWQDGHGVAVCICGTGNNGGDGLAAMRMLAQANDAFVGECWMLPGTLTPDAQREMERLRKHTPQVRVRWMAEEGVPDFQPACVIDAMFGTGLSRPLDGLALAMCEKINGWQAPVIAVDIPSGLNGLTGEVMGNAVHADRTVTFHRPKTGLYLGAGPDYTGEIVVADIGLNAPEAVRLDDADGCEVLEKSDLLRLLPKRSRCTHKGHYGKVLILAGSRGMAGAAAICATAALRAGAGLVCIACPEAIVDTVQVLCPCATCVPLPKSAREAVKILHEKLEWADAVAVGCGLGTSAWAGYLLNRVMEWLAENEIPAVLDADALNLMAQSEMAKAESIITPHPAEAARLLHMDTAQVVSDPQKAARRLAECYDAVILKSACSLLCAEGKMAINPFGTPAMAKGGSGDALTGIVAALLAGRRTGAYRMSRLELMQTACALHGLAGEMAAKRFGERGMLATDLCECIGLVEGEKKKEKEETRGLIRTLGRQVTITVEHMYGSREENGLRRSYPFNCGYVQEVLDEQNEWQDACIFGVDMPLEWFEGIVKATARIGDRQVWIATHHDAVLTASEVEEGLRFLGDATDISVL